MDSFAKHNACDQVHASRGCQLQCRLIASMNMQHNTNPVYDDDMIRCLQMQASMGLPQVVLSAAQACKATLCLDSVCQHC